MIIVIVIIIAIAIAMAMAMPAILRAVRVTGTIPPRVQRRPPPGACAACVASELHFQEPSCRQLPLCATSFLCTS